MLTLSTLNRRLTARLASACVWSLVLLPSPSRADPWGAVVDRLAENARAVERSETHLVIAVPELHHRLVLSAGRREGADIWFELRSRRGRNPYRAWYLRRDFARDPPVPKNDWPRFLRVEFLRLLRIAP